MPASRSASPSPSYNNHSQDPSEITTLLPPSSSSRPHTPSNHSHPHPNLPGTHGTTHHRKPSLGGRSVAGSIRGYGAVPVRPGPVEQAPRVSKKGQRRVLTTFPLQLAFIVLVILTFLSLVLSLILFLNTAIDLSALSLPYRGSGFAEFWMAAVGSWIGIGGVFFFSHPSYLFFLTTLLTLLVLPPILLLTLVSSHLYRLHHPLMLIPLLLTFLTLLLTILSNYLVRRARYKESQRVVRMLSDNTGRGGTAVGDEAVARALVGLEGKGVWGGIVSFVGGVIGLVAGLAGLIVVTLLIIDLAISAYDGSIDLPSSASQLISLHPISSPWSLNVHLACVDPANRTSNYRQTESQITMSKASPSSDQSLKKQAPSTLPTILYEPPSGIPGSLALLPSPLTPTTFDNATNPGRWLFDLQDAGEVGRICVWDRPGYGFSEGLVGADIGGVADILWETLKTSGEVKLAGNAGFMLVGEGFGGLLTRIFASRHPSHVHSILHLDVQTASTYFNENPNGRSQITLFLHRITTRLLPYLLTPLSIRRLPSVLLRRSSSLSRILASAHPDPSTTYLNDNILKARLQETFGAHSHTSSAFKALLESGHDYPKDLDAIVISSADRMKEEEGWAEGQRGLVEEVTGEDGLVRWVKVKGVGHWVCEGSGRGECENAIRDLL